MPDDAPAVKPFVCTPGFWLELLDNDLPPREFFTIHAAHDCLSVSYTHLDVYKRQELLSRQLSPPKDRVADLQALGVTPDGRISGSQRAMLLEYVGRAGPEYWLGFANFYVITRYNRSQLYALAVYQLSQAIGGQYERSSMLDAVAPERVTAAH